MSALLLLTIAFKIYQIFNFNKKETIALFIKPDGNPEKELGIKDLSKEWFEYDGGAYLIRPASVKLGNKRLLFYEKGNQNPIDFLASAQPSGLNTVAMNRVLKNELVADLARLRGGGLADWFNNINWAAVLIIGAIIIGGYLMLTRGVT